MKTILSVLLFSLLSMSSFADDSYYDYRDGKTYQCTLVGSGGGGSDCYRDLTEKICQRYTTSDGKCTYYTTTKKTVRCDSGCYEQEVCERYLTATGECTYYNTYVRCP